MKKLFFDSALWFVSYFQMCVELVGGPFRDSLEYVDLVMVLVSASGFSGRVMLTGFCLFLAPCPNPNPLGYGIRIQTK